MTPLEALVALNMLPKIGPVRVRRLLEAFGDPAAILGAAKDRLMRVDGIGEETAKILQRWQDHADPAAEIREAAERGISIVTQEDEDYPAPLRKPMIRRCCSMSGGNSEARDKHAISVVGSRRATHYGMQATKKLSYQIAQAGFTIISGLARGIDTAAHEAAVAANGRTIAVLGSGLAKLYPPENLGARGKNRQRLRRGGFRVPAAHLAGQADVSRCATASSPLGRGRCWSSNARHGRVR